MENVLDLKASAKILTELRGNKSQKEVADALGISVSALSMYENGERVPRDNIKIRIANYYQKGISDIFFIVQNHETWD